MSFGKHWLIRFLCTGLTVTVYLYLFPNLARGVFFSNAPLPRITSVYQSWGVLQINRSTSETPLKINGVRYWSGLGTHASSTIQFTAPGFAKKFSGACGLDDNSGGRGEFICSIEVNQRQVWKSRNIDKNNAIEHFSITIKESDIVVLVTQALPKGNEFAHANWVELNFHPGVDH